LRLFFFGGYGLALVVLGAYDSYPKYQQANVPNVCADSFGVNSLEHSMETNRRAHFSTYSFGSMFSLAAVAEKNV